MSQHSSLQLHYVIWEVSWAIHCLYSKKNVLEEEWHEWVCFDVAIERYIVFLQINVEDFLCTYVLRRLYKRLHSMVFMSTTLAIKSTQNQR